MAYLVMLIWNLFVLGGTAYLVFERGHSGWWFLLALLLMQNVSEKE